MMLYFSVLLNPMRRMDASQCLGNHDGVVV